MGQKYITGYRAQTRAKSVRYTVAITLLVLILAVLQVSLFSRFRIFGAVPDLMLCTVVCVAFFSGRFAGAITGIGAGFLIEALGSVGISILPVAYLICGYLVGHYARAVIPRRFLLFLLYFAIALILRVALTLTYVCLTYAQVSLPSVIVGILLPELAATALCGCALYAPIKLLCNCLEKNKP
ncbi:MAG: rod shape-determining protein MreD [Clostridia bacterium]|nr:rod shape-determining protein MreD [Clostridia bacterium]